MDFMKELREKMKEGKIAGTPYESTATIVARRALWSMCVRFATNDGDKNDTYMDVAESYEKYCGCSIESMNLDTLMWCINDLRHKLGWNYTSIEALLDAEFKDED